jgi:hypothetical protein
MSEAMSYTSKHALLWLEIFNPQPVFKLDDHSLLAVSMTAYSIQTLIDDSREVGLEINVEVTKYMFIFQHQNVGQNHDIRIANR